MASFKLWLVYELTVGPGQQGHGRVVPARSIGPMCSVDKDAGPPVCTVAVGTGKTAEAALHTFRRNICLRLRGCRFSSEKLQTPTCLFLIRKLQLVPKAAHREGAAPPSSTFWVSD